MSRTIKSVFYSKLTFFNLLEAHKRACLNKGNKGEILKFNLHLEKHLINLMEEIRTDTYRVSNYSEFKVKEPKERTIRKLPYKDRIVHQWYIGEFIKPYIVKGLYQIVMLALKEKVHTKEFINYRSICE